MEIIKKLKHFFKKRDIPYTGIKAYKNDFTASSVNGYVKILDKNKIKRNNDQWDLFVPNGYGQIERDLKKLTIDHPNQIIMGIRGCDNIVSKANLWRLLEKKYGRKIASTIMPETFVLKNHKHQDILKQNHKEGDIFILKKKLQRKQGLKLTSSLSEILEGKEEKYKIAQKYERNLLLINGRKLNLRIYLLLVCRHNKLIAYISKFGTCIYTNKDYNDDTFDFETNITSFNLDLSIYDTNPMTLKQLQSYLIENGFDGDILFDRINKKVGMMIQSVKDSLGHKKFENNLCFQIFGMDFIVDKDLNPYLLECNKGPDMSPKMNSGTYLEMIKKIEQLHIDESDGDVNHKPVGYITGNGLKVQRDALDLLKIINIENPCQGFYEIV